MVAKQLRLFRFLQVLAFVVPMLERSGEWVVDWGTSECRAESVMMLEADVLESKCANSSLTPSRK